MNSKLMVGMAVMVVAVANVSASVSEFVTFGMSYPTRPYSLSADGSTVVGIAHVPQPNYSEAFRWTRAGGMEFLGEVPGGEHRPNALGVNADGSVVVGYDSAGPTGYNWQAWRWTANTGMVGMGYIGGSDPTYDFSNCYDVSADGTVIVGHTESPQGRQAFRWREQTGMVGIGDLPGSNFDSIAEGVSDDGSVIVGRSVSGHRANEAFRWTAETGMVPLGTLPNGSYDTAALDVSADGQVVVGFATNADSQREAIRWSAEAGMVGLGILPGKTHSNARAASADGSVIVGVSEGRAFIWTAELGMRDLTDYLTIDCGLDLRGYVLTNATAISNDGKVITGMSDFDDGWVAVIPEPTSLSLLALGGLAVLRRRK